MNKKTMKKKVKEMKEKVRAKANEIKDAVWENRGIVCWVAGCMVTGLGIGVADGLMAKRSKPSTMVDELIATNKMIHDNASANTCFFTMAPYGDKKLTLEDVGVLGKSAIGYFASRPDCPDFKPDDIVLGATVFVDKK